MGIPLRVLIVEDSENDALLLVRELRRGGYEPSFERIDSAEAMQKALEWENWDLVVTDHNMPVFSSTEAIALLKKSGKDIPFIIVSGSIGEDVAVAAMKQGAHDYIMKNNLARLVPAIERELREAQTRHAHREAEEAIRYMAFHDALTSLVNRNEFERRLTQALESAHEKGLTHALLYLDLDQFKVINDTCGHAAGDELLKQLASVLKRQIRDKDTLARLGGDEFGVLLEKCPFEFAKDVAEKLRRVIEDYRFNWSNKAFGIGVSIGLVGISKTSGNVNDILSTADMACYAAKDLGRNRIYIYRENDLDLVRRRKEMKWVSHIKYALEQNHFRLYRQVIIPLVNHDGAKHYELLVRLQNDQGEIVPPGAFIPAAERYNLMPALDRWVIRTAFSYLAALPDIGDCNKKNPSTYFINLSGASLSDDSFYEFVREQLYSHKIPPQRVCFEITETAAISNFSKAIEFIRDIKNEGCCFALDDFGSGLSSFTYLRDIPVDYLKIDGTFVQNMLDDAMGCAIVESITQVGHVAGLKIISEFVESDAIRQKLTEIGVDYAQGYGIEAPSPLDWEIEI